MRMSSHSVQTPKIPIITKILIGINVILFAWEVVLLPTLSMDLVSDYCLSPAKIINEYKTSEYTINGVSSLLLSNLFHLNPFRSGAMGIFHILMNMMTLLSMGKYLEKQLGSLIFLGITILFLLFIGPIQIPIAIFFNYITMNSISLLSINQCGVGYSGVLFAYFMIYLRLIPSGRVNFCGYQIKKWMLPFIQLLLLSLLLRASFIGHLSGIVTGIIYISGVPGFFITRQIFIKEIENVFCMKCIKNRNDYYPVSQQPKINNFKPSIGCIKGNTVSNSVSDESDTEIDEYESDEQTDLIPIENI